MGSSKRHHSLGIWFLALGYFLTYIPYSGLAKAVTSGLWINGASISGFKLLEPAAISTLLLVFGFISAMGWWKYCTTKRIFNLSVPWPSLATLISGLGYAAIIATTTLAYSFNAVSILLALLLMRGGVLILAPLIDFVFRRRVRWFSWTGLLLSVAALVSAFQGVRSFHLGRATLMALAVYLTGYAVRLPCMSKAGKVEERTAKLRYFVDEQLVAMPALVMAPLLWGLLSRDGAAREMGNGIAHFFISPATLPGLAIGAFYAGLGTFCTFIYLDRRENTFCIPIYSCSSLLSGVVASYGLHIFVHVPVPGNGQLVGVAFMMSALLVLSPLHHLPEKLARFRQRLRADEGVAGIWTPSDTREVKI
jgi:hypothetical protein